MNGNRNCRRIPFRRLGLTAAFSVDGQWSVAGLRFAYLAGGFTRRREVGTSPKRTIDVHFS